MYSIFNLKNHELKRCKTYDKPLLEPLKKTMKK